MKFRITVLFIWVVQYIGAQPHAGSMLTMCGDPSPKYADILVWNIPETVGVVSLKSNNSLCWSINKTIAGFTCDGWCLYLDTCSPNSLQFNVENSTQIVVSKDPIHSTEGHCLDLESNLHLQIYPCVFSKNQHFNASKANGFFIDEWTGMHLLVGVSGPECKAAPEPAFCPQYHPIRDKKIYDPSGPILTDDGVWHMWEDLGAWSHYTSRDLIHWELSSPSTKFSGLTGSVVATPSGFYAFWPNGAQNGIESAVAADVPTLNVWTHRGVSITAPSYAGKNFRDPLRALQFPETGGKDWYIGVGCNNHSKSADVCLFKATNDSLIEFKSVGSLFSTTKTFGQMDSNIIWNPTPKGATMFECPDVFPLGNKYMLIGSLFATNQWWIGTVKGSPDAPQFSAENVGLMDYGNGYAAKTGSKLVQTGTSRRVVFSFTGWNEPTAVQGCGRTIILPRDITLGKDGLSPRIKPIPETKVLRLNSTYMVTKLKDQKIVSRSTSNTIKHVFKGDLAVGSQVELSVDCKLPKTPPSNGKLALKVLGTEDGSEYLEIGYDFGNQSMYADHTKCCDSDHPNSIIQRAPLPVASFDTNVITINVWVDGGLVEAFVNGQVTITPLVAPSSKTDVTKRKNTFLITAPGIEVDMCKVESWQLSY